MDLQLWEKVKKKKKLTYPEIAKASGIPVTTVTNIFCGYVKTPRIDTVEAIERALGIRDEITPEEYAAGARDTIKVSVTADEEDILDKYREVYEAYGEDGKKLTMSFWNLLLSKT